MVSSEGIFIPFYLKKNFIPMFHPDNIDWLETTPDGENTSNLLGLSVFQPRINEKCEPIILDLENTESLTLINNSFN